MCYNEVTNLDNGLPDGTLAAVNNHSGILKGARLGLLVALTLTSPLFGRSQTASPAGTNEFPGLKNAVILLIRHAEKPPDGAGLTPAGELRAEAYVGWFKNLQLDSQLVKLDALFAAADSAKSHRPRLTIEPLSRALGMKIDTRFGDKHPEEFVRELRAQDHGHCLLVAWRHGAIPALLRLLDADPAQLLPDAKWPDAVFDWMIELRFDEKGRLIPGAAKRINEKLMPGDSKS